MTSIPKMRGEYFAILRTGLGVSDDRQRHELNRQLIGGESVRGLDEWQWTLLLLRVAQVAPTDRPLGVRLTVPDRRGDSDWDRATPEQCAYLIQLCHEVSWESGAEPFIRQRVLNELRRRNWDGWFDSLWKAEATQAICVIQKYAKQQRKGEAA